MRKIILALALLAATAFGLLQDNIQAASYTCYSDGENAFCSSAVLDYSVLGSYSTAAECAAYCGY